LSKLPDRQIADVKQQVIMPMLSPGSPINALKNLIATNVPQKIRQTVKDSIISIALIKKRREYLMFALSSNHLKCTKGVVISQTTGEIP